MPISEKVEDGLNHNACPITSSLGCNITSHFHNHSMKNLFKVFWFLVIDPWSDKRNC